MGAWLNLKGEASVGEIVTFMGFATHLLGRMDQVVGFVNGLFMEVHSLGNFRGAGHPVGGGRPPGRPAD